MASIPPGRHTSPSSKYPYVGSNYDQYGEVPGYVYIPQTDKYYLNQQSIIDQEKAQGAIPKTPTTLQQILPAAEGAAAGATLSELGKGIVTGGFSGLKGLFGAASQPTGQLLDSATQSSLDAAAQTPTTFSWGAQGADAATTNANGIIDSELGSSTGSGSSGLLGAGNSDTVVAPTPSSGGIGGSGIGAPGSYGSYVGMAFDAFNAAKALSDTKNLSKKQQVTAVDKAGGMAVADFFTGGLASLGRLLVNQTGFGRGLERKVDAFRQKYDPVIRIEDALAHETTSQATKRNFGDLAGQSSDEAWQKLVGQDRDLSLSQQDPDYTFSAKKAAGTLTPDDVRNSYGVLQTFGTDLLKYTPEQENKILQALITNNQFNSHKGDIHITDPDEAKRIAQEALSAPSEVVGGSKPGAVLKMGLLGQGEPQTGSAFESTPPPAGTAPSSGPLGNGSLIQGAQMATGNPLLSIAAALQSGEGMSRFPNQAGSNVFLK